MSGRSATSRSERPLLNGCSVLLQQIDPDQGPAQVIELLTERYETLALDQQGLYRVTVDDARFPDEAVVRLASVLDELDSGWSESFAWPKATSD